MSINETTPDEQQDQNAKDKHEQESKAQTTPVKASTAKPRNRSKAKEADQPEESTVDKQDVSPLEALEKKILKLAEEIDQFDLDTGANLSDISLAANKLRDGALVVRQEVDVIREREKNQEKYANFGR